MIRDLVAGLTDKLNRELIWLLLCSVCVLGNTAPVYADPHSDPFTYRDHTAVEPTAAVDGPIEELLKSIVSVDVNTIENARTAKSFGSSRTGSGVVLDASGLVVTAGYLVAEAEDITIKFSDGDEARASLVAYDNATGLGLLRASGNKVTTPIRIGDSSEIDAETLAMIIPTHLEDDAQAVKVGKINKYSGGWEYIINDALHTYPPSTQFIGAALVSDSAQLLGIGALVTIDIDIDPKVRVPGNVFIPVNSLMDVIGELMVDGRSQASRKAWIGVDTKKAKQGVSVASLMEDGPAEKSGLRTGDIVKAVAGKKIEGQIDFYEKVWDSKPGEEVHLLVLRGNEYLPVSIQAIDYYDWLNQKSTNIQYSDLVE